MADEQQTSGFDRSQLTQICYESRKHAYAIAHSCSVFLLLCFLLSTYASAQTTEFTYQGSRNIGAPPSPATGNYDFEFRLFSVDTGGSAISTLQRLNVAVSNGSFSVKLDFGAQFPGDARYLEIAARSAGGGS